MVSTALPAGIELWDAVPAEQLADAKVVSLLQGRVTPDMNFVEKVWALTAQVPAGKVTTYAALAAALDSQAYRAVGMAMNRNPYAPAVPCHRVVGSDGRLTGYAGGLSKKLRLLREEGIRFKETGETLAGEAPERARVELRDVSQVHRF